MMAAGSDWTRRGFLHVGGVGLVAALVSGCGLTDSDSDADDGPEEASADGTVIVVGAGPAGMTTAHLLQQRGVDVRVLEALGTYGGRIAHTRDFADFPISLGGEWIHVERTVLDDIVNDDAVEIETVTTPYSPDDDFAIYDGTSLVALTAEEMGFGIDQKFVGSSWLDFFETYIVPGISSSITYDTAVERIEHGDFGVRLIDREGGVHEADRVVVTVPVKILQLGLVEFDPPLPDRHIEALEEANVWSGFKAFIEFDERFYPTALATLDSETEGGQRLYYDAAYGQTTGEHVLGVFAVGEQAEALQAAGESVIDGLLAELDEIFDGAATRSYVQHVTQNWNDQPWAQGAYLTDSEDTGVTRALAASIDGRVFFAGDGYTAFDDWSSVHAAAWSARDAVEELLG